MTGTFYSNGKIRDDDTLGSNNIIKNNNIIDQFTISKAVSKVKINATDAATAIDKTTNATDAAFPSSSLSSSR